MTQYLCQLVEGFEWNLAQILMSVFVEEVYEVRRDWVTIER